MTHSMKAVLLQALVEKDAKTAEHCVRVSTIAGQLAVVLKVERSQLEPLLYASLMHDVGKLGTPDRVLLKPDRLNAEEWEVMKEHSSSGERILASAQLPEIDLIGKVVRHVHENFDGTGYPDGLAGEDIPLLSRIIAVADSFDAMRQERAYKVAISNNVAFRYIKQSSGIRYDPIVIEALEELLFEFYFDSE